MSDKKANVLLLDRLQKTLLKIGNTNEEIANTLGCDHSTVNKWYNGKLTPSLDKLVLICKTANVSIDYLCGLREAATNNMQVSDISEYTGLNEQAIKKLYELNRPNSVYEEGSEDWRFEKKYAEIAADKNKNIINHFISSKVFDYFVNSASQLININDNVMNYLSLYFQDFSYFELVEGSDGDLIQNAKYFLHEYEHEPAHNALQDQQALILFKVQRAITSYLEQIPSALFAINSNDLSVTFDWMRYMIYSIINDCCRNKKGIETYIEEINSLSTDGFEEKIIQLKKIYEKAKSN